MPRIRFTKDFDFKVKPQVTISYRAGNEYLVSQAASEQAVSKGCGVLLSRPNRRERRGSNVGG